MKTRLWLLIICNLVVISACGSSPIIQETESVLSEGNIASAVPVTNAPSETSIPDPDLAGDGEVSARDAIALDIIERYQADFGPNGPSYSLQDIDDPDLTALFGRVKFFHLTLYITEPPKESIIAFEGGKVFGLPMYFNLLLDEKGIEITEENLVDIAFAFAKGTDPFAISYLELQRESVQVTEEEGWWRAVQFTTYSKLGGIVTEWNFLFDSWSNVSSISEQIIETGAGDFIEVPIDYRKDEDAGWGTNYAPQR